MYERIGRGIGEESEHLTWEQIQAQTAEQYSPRQDRDQVVEQPVPWWFSWAAAGVGLVSIIAIGSILTRGH